MIGTTVDHIVSWFSPARAARRQYARTIYDRLKRRSYDAAKSDRTNSFWNPTNQSSDLAMQADAATIRARARDLVRNNAYAKGILRALVRNVVGSGIFPQATTGSDRLDDEIETLFRRWATMAEASGRLTFWELQQLVFQEVCEAGECLVHFVSLDRDRGRPVPLGLELIDADRLVDDQVGYVRLAAADGNEIRRGVEIDSVGRPVAYWIYPQHPNDINTRWTQPVRYPASEFLHLYKSERIGQTRGVSLFAPVITWLKNLHYYTENELQASAVASCFTAAIKTMAGPADGGLLDSIDSDNTDEDGNTLEYLQPGMVARLMPGEEVEIINPTRPNTQADAWIAMMLRSMATGVGLSYERMARDYTQTNYSSARASDLEDRREFRVEQDWLCAHLCTPVYLRFLESAVAAGKLSLSAEQLLADYRNVTSHYWQKPGWEWVDPVKEATSSQLALASNLTTLADELGQRGRDLVTTLRQRQKENVLIKQFGLQSEAKSNEVGNVEKTPATTS